MGRSPPSTPKSPIDSKGRAKPGFWTPGLELKYPTTANSFALKHGIGKNKLTVEQIILIVGNDFMKRCWIHKYGRPLVKNYIAHTQRYFRHQPHPEKNTIPICQAIVDIVCAKHQSFGVTEDKLAAAVRSELDISMRQYIQTEKIAFDKQNPQKICNWFANHKPSSDRLEFIHTAKIEDFLEAKGWCAKGKGNAPSQ